jgi:hypothetical protein
MVVNSVQVSVLRYVGIEPIQQDLVVKSEMAARQAYAFGGSIQELSGC